MIHFMYSGLTLCPVCILFSIVSYIQNKAPLLTCHTAKKIENNIDSPLNSLQTGRIKRELCALCEQPASLAITLCGLPSLWTVAMTVKSAP